jgi:hypothetical protein
MSGFGTDEGFSLKIGRFRQLAAGFVAKRASAAPPAQARAAPTAAAPVIVDTSDFDNIDDLDIDLDPTKWARAITAAGDLARAGGSHLVKPSGVAAEILAAAALARAGGPQRPPPESLAAAIIAAGIKRRAPRGG